MTRRALTEPLFHALFQGMLAPLARRAREDTTLCLELRGRAFSLYYRGGRVLHVEAPAVGYRFDFDPRYFRGRGSPPAGRPDH